jgi:hypothetical protein
VLCCGPWLPEWNFRNFPKALHCSLNQKLEV